MVNISRVSSDSDSNLQTPLERRQHESKRSSKQLKRTKHSREDDSIYTLGWFLWETCNFHKRLYIDVTKLPYRSHQSCFSCWYILKFRYDNHYSSLSLSMSNHLKKSCFDYFLLDDSPSRMVEVKESYDLKLWLFIIKFISLPKVIIWQIIWLANTLCHKNSQDNWCIVMLCGILNQRKSEQSPF